MHMSSLEIYNIIHNSVILIDWGTFKGRDLCKLLTFGPSRVFQTLIIYISRSILHFKYSRNGSSGLQILVIVELISLLILL